MNRPILLRLLVPLGIVLLGEVLLRAGLWEGMAEPSSRIGATVALKQRLAHESESGPFRIVTLGNSRAEHGLDHDLLRSMAARHGQNHVPAIIRGAHWLTWTELSRWIEDRHPEVDNALIAISVADLFHVDNGSFEVRMAEPLRSGLWPSREARLLFDRKDPATYGIVSSLLAYRADLADFVRDPPSRLRALEAAPSLPAAPSRPASRDLCGLPYDDLLACARHAPKDLLEIDIVGECQRTLALVEQRQDWTPPLAESLAREREFVRNLRQQQLSRMPYRRPVVLLMPVLKLWRDDVYPVGYEAWVDTVLRPLAESGRIGLIDATKFFDSGPEPECRAFEDLYHQRPASARALTQSLLPQIEVALFGTAVTRP